MKNYIVCPVVAGREMTKRAITSALAQDIGDIEVIAIDNGSTDGCAQLLRSLPVSYWPRSERSLNRVWNEALSHVFDSRGVAHVLVINNDVVLRQDTYRLLRDNGGPFVTAVSQREEVRYTDAYMDGQAHVKISHFTRQGLRVTGVVHVGANDGYEIEFYRKMGARVLAFEPLAHACEAARAKYRTDPDVEMHNFGLSDKLDRLVLNVTPGDGQGSSFLVEHNSPEIVGQQEAVVERFDQLGFSLAGFNTLVVDVQGMELQVLKGFGDRLKEFEFLNIECSRVPLYEGEASAQEVIDYLDSQGFAQDSPIEDHNDIMFIRKGTQRLGETSRPHPDFSCFLMRRSVWEQVGQFDEDYWAYCSDCDYHVRMYRAGIEAICLSVPFFHESSGTLKQVSPEKREQILRLADQDRQRFQMRYGCLPGTPEYNALFEVARV